VLSGIERKTGWLLAEQAGAARPYRMQSLLGRSRWEADELMYDVRSYVVEALGDPDGVLVVDETGFLKKGTQSVGVGRQYCGTAGRIENCQVGVFQPLRPRVDRSAAVFAEGLGGRRRASSQSRRPR
jgi:SRSO17 transposase